MINIETVLCLTDNYAYILHDQQNNKTVVIDAPEAEPILNHLQAMNWHLDEVWVTHHHDDHVGGIPALQASYPELKIVGAQADHARLPPLDIPVVTGESFYFEGHTVQVLDVSGHTIGHVAYYIPAAQAVFTADSLFILGCGRIFEGTPQMMYESLQRLAALPKETKVYCGHEYTMSNAAFALHVDPHNTTLQARVKELCPPTVPSTIGEELESNPFLRTNQPALYMATGMPESTSAREVFAALRQMKDRF